eukprot:9608188-Alexandrium_andersonii.AAC.1
MCIRDRRGSRRRVHLESFEDLAIIADVARVVHELRAQHLEDDALGLVSVAGRSVVVFALAAAWRGRQGF